MSRRIGIMGAMPEEIDGLAACFAAGARQEHSGLRQYVVGSLWGQPSVLVFSRCGKVAAATTATHLILAYGVTELVFVGLAGGIDPRLRIGDTVVARALVQHDMDARPIFPRYEVPLAGKAIFDVDPGLQGDCLAACEAFLAELPGLPEVAALRALGIDAPRVVTGLVASGDQFLASPAAAQDLRARLPDACCVEMEGAAVAQVCSDYGVPLGVIRTLSDTASHTAAVDFTRFAAGVAPLLARGFLHHLYRRRYAGA